MRIVNFQETLKNPVLNTDTKGFYDEKDLSSYKDNCITVTITKEFVYRPDLLAEYYLGSSENSWIITYVNNFENGIKDYKLGRKIKIPQLN